MNKQQINVDSSNGAVYFGSVMHNGIAKLDYARNPTFTLYPLNIRFAGVTLQEQCHGNAYASGWHTDLKTGERKKHNRGERLMLIVSELAESMEGNRKNKMDDHLPDLPNHAVELADAVIRCFDEAGDCGYDLGDIIARKLEYNSRREDHKIEVRKGEGGKAY